MDLRFVKGDITNVVADAIVLPANEKLKEGSGTSAAIFKKAGRKELTMACKGIGKCKVGSAVPTLAYGISARYIIHAVVPKWIDGEHNEYETLCSAYLSALEIANKLKCESVAFPLLASGNNGFDKELAIKIAKEAVGQYQSEVVTDVMIMVYDDNSQVSVTLCGYEISDEVCDTEVMTERKIQMEAFKKTLFEGRDAAVDMTMKAMAMAIDWIKDEENQNKMLNVACSIVGAIIMNKLPKKDK